MLISEVKKKIHCRNNSKIHSNNHRNSGKIDTTNRQIHDRSNSSFGTGSSMKSGGANPVLCPIPHLLLK